MENVYWRYVSGRLMVLLKMPRRSGRQPSAKRWLASARNDAVNNIALNQMIMLAKVWEVRPASPNVHLKSSVAVFMRIPSITNTAET